MLAPGLVLTEANVANFTLTVVVAICQGIYTVCHETACLMLKLFEPHNIDGLSF